MPFDAIWITAAIAMIVVFMGIGALVIGAIDRLPGSKKRNPLPMFLDPELKKKFMEKYRPGKDR